MYRSILITGAFVCLLAGCSAPSPYEGKEYEDAISTPVLPYVVKIGEIQFVDVDVADGMAEDDPEILGVQPAEIADSENELKIRESLKAALEEYEVFTLVAYDDTELQSRNLQAELVMDVTIEARMHLRQFPHEATSMKWWNLFLWLFAGFPGWIIDDMHVDPGVENIICRLSSPATTTARGEVFRREIDLTDADLLNFMRRASWQEYLMNIIIPPFLISSDRETADESLFENYVSRMQSGISREIKGGLSRDLVGEAPQLIVISPVKVGDVMRGAGGAIDVLVFSDDEAETVRVEHVGVDAEPKTILQEELVPVGSSQWKAKASGVLTGEVDYLGQYGSVFGITVEDALDDVSPSDGSYLRFTVAFSTRTGTVTRTWTAPY